MNNYDLINALLEDGSEASILKLKMVVDFDNFFKLWQIDKNNRVKFVLLFEEQYKKEFSKNPYIIQYIPVDKMFDIIKIFNESFGNGFYEHADIIYFIPEDKRFDVVIVCKEQFKKLFSEYSNAIAVVPDEKRLDIVKIFEDSFEKGFTENPKAISYIPEQNRKQVKKMFPKVRWDKCERSFYSNFDLLLEQNKIFIFINKIYNKLVKIFTKNKV